jgi:hypothetical protein
MADPRNIRNSGVFIGGNNSHSPISMGGTGPAGGMDEAEVLRHIDTLFTKLLADVLQLPAEQAGAAAYQTAQLKAEVTAPHRDPTRIQAVLGSLRGAVATAAPLVEIVKDIAELVTSLH